MISISILIEIIRIIIVGKIGKSFSRFWHKSLWFEL